MSDQDKKPESTEENPSPAPSRKRRWAVRLFIAFAILSVLGASVLGVAEHETSKADFCASCHIMEPYYASWSADLHGSKLDVACVECHYAPGERTTIKAKFRGLSQVTSYFSGRYGSGRPRAYVSNLSCLTAKCHGDKKFMDKAIQVGTVKFSHAKHLARTEEMEQPQQARLEELQKQLRDTLGEEHFNELQILGSIAGSAKPRYDAMVAQCEQWESTVDRETLVEYSQLLHRDVRITQLNDLQCTNCHAYSSPNQEAFNGKTGHHFQVATTTCYTCHFNNEDYNTGTSTCLSCHTPPQGEILVHAEKELKGGEDNDDAAAAKPVMMNHTDMLARKVACISCHADAIQHDATVTRRDCERCHDRPEFFKDWKEPFTLDLVKHYHSVHVERQKAKCQDCHAEIQHKLVREEGNFLTSALADCARCHPNHHTEQVGLLLGHSGSGAVQGEPNLMFGSRTNCSGCHTELTDDLHGGIVKATEQSCIACHGDKHEDTFMKWKLGLELVMEDADSAYANAKKLLDEKTELPAEVRDEAAKLIRDAEADLRMVKVGNGLHNITFAMELLDSVTTRCRQAATLLSKE
ncbi:MAG: NapC/NirT family cytochrome c [Planctomycetales bacterium]|nr:NapC/NirT family cytochrome c [Planctomycetales bacterium]